METKHPSWQSLMPQSILSEFPSNYPRRCLH